jgi:hypothetical protein
MKWRTESTSRVPRRQQLFDVILTIPLRRASDKTASTIYNRGSVNDRILVTCPYCGEEVELYLESDVEGAFVQDCEVCCNPWTVRVTTDGDDRHVEVRRGDGSE